MDHICTCIVGDPVSYTLQNLKDDIKQPENKAKFKPILLSFSGLSDRRSERIKAAQHLVASESLKQEAKDVTAKSRSTHHFTTEMHFEPVVLSAFKEVFLSKKIEPCFDDASTTEICEFGQRDPVDEHFRFIYRYLSNQLKYSGSKSDHNDKKPKSEILTKSSYNEETSVVNIWDLAIDRIIRHFLAAIQGHLYNHHMWLFIDLEEDLDNLDKPPENSDLMSWRPRLHYLLRSCKLSEDKEKERRKVCTLFAEYNGSIKTEELHKKVKILEDKVQSVAKHIGVSALLEEKIEAINFEGDDNSHRLLYKMLQHTINQTPHKEIPISWVFLRSLFYHLDQDIITRVDLQKMAKSCGIDADLNEFCKFYTSFGSIFDLSLVDPNYQFVILKPINFLKSLESLIFHPADATTKYGIVPEDKCRKLFDGYMDHFMSALVSLGLAARITRLQLELSADEFADNEDFYYVPIIRSENVSEVDQRAVHVLTSIDTPHIFKQVTVTKHLLCLLPRAKLVLSEYRNQTIIKDHSSDTTITLVSHSPATRLQLSKPDEHVCSCIVQAYEKIAEKARSQGITVEYKFVKICAESRLSDVQSIPSCCYHILPDKKLCTECNETRRTEEVVEPTLLEVWNKSLTEVSSLMF